LIDIRPLAVADPASVEALLDAAFGADRHGRTAYRLRAGTLPLPGLSFAAFDTGQLVGTLQSWPVQLNAARPGVEPARLTMVGPVAVLPERQQQGIGRALMDRLIETADSQGEDALMLIGDPEYYDRLFGFNATHTGGWEVPGPVERHRLLARLASDRLHGASGMLGPATCEPAALR
jgi:predicted N-acetyltransferase YhbS